MTLDRLEWHLENWTEWMRRDTHKLGYPAKSLMIASGGGSGIDEFECMCKNADENCARSIDGIIDSITKPQQTAINHTWLKVKHHYPTHELDLIEAYEHIIKICNKRGVL